MMQRGDTVTRKTKETEINAYLNLGGKGEHDISTGIGFLDHMLTAFALHGGFDLELECKGDLQVDCHHTVEDVGIVLGSEIREALKQDDVQYMRYGSARIPMDESLGWCDIDISARPFLVFRAEFNREKVGELETQMVKEFMRAVVYNSGITLHIGADGENDHHKIEAMFKAFAYALKRAVRINPNGKIISTKGEEQIAKGVVT